MDKTKIYILITEISLDGEINFDVQPYDNLNKAKIALYHRVKDEYNKMLEDELEPDDELNVTKDDIEYYIPFNNNDYYINCSIQEKEIL